MTKKYFFRSIIEFGDFKSVLFPTPILSHDYWTGFFLWSRNFPEIPVDQSISSAVEERHQHSFKALDLSLLIS